MACKLLGIKIARPARACRPRSAARFGGKTVVYVEPVAVMLSRKSGHPVKIMMSREDVFKATGPTSGASMTIKIGVMKDGKIVAADGALQVSGGRVPRLAGHERAACAASRRTTSRTCAPSATTWCATGRRSAAYRAPGSPISRVRRGEHDGRCWRRRSAWTRSQLQAEERRQDRARSCCHGAKIGARRLCRNPAGAAEASRLHEAARQEPGTRHGRRATGSTAAANRARPCTSTRTARPWSRPAARTSAARAPRWRMMAAETLGIEYDQVRPIVADTEFGRLHAGRPAARASPSRPAGGDRRVQQDVIEEMCARAAKIWEIDPRGRDLGRRRSAGRRAATPASSRR